MSVTIQVTYAVSALTTYLHSTSNARGTNCLLLIAVTLAANGCKTEFFLGFHLVTLETCYIREDLDNLPGSINRR